LYSKVKRQKFNRFNISQKIKYVNGETPSWMLAKGFLC